MKKIFTVGLTLCLAMFSFFQTQAIAGEGYLDPNRPHVCASGTVRAEMCQQWIKTVTRPDIVNQDGSRTASCCGTVYCYNFPPLT